MSSSFWGSLAEATMDASIAAEKKKRTINDPTLMQVSDHDEIVSEMQTKIDELQKWKDELVQYIPKVGSSNDVKSRIEKAEKVIEIVVNFSKPSEKFTMRNLAIEYQRKYLRTGL